MATSHPWQVTRRRNGDNTLAYLEAIPPRKVRQACIGVEAAQRLLRLFIILIAERKMPREIQRNQPKLGSIAVGINGRDVLMLFRTSLQLHLARLIVVDINMILFLVIACKSLGRTTRCTHWLVVLALNYVAVPPECLAIECRD